MIRLINRAVAGYHAHYQAGGVMIRLITSCWQVIRLITRPAAGYQAHYQLVACYLAHYEAGGGMIRLITRPVDE